MEKERIAYLYRQYQLGFATTEELEEFQSVVKDPGSKVLLNEIVDASYYSISEGDLIEMDDNRYTEIFDFIVSHKNPVSKVKNLWRRVSVAAAILVFLGVGIVFFKSHLPRSGNGLNAANQILPGKVGATLTLASGKRIRLGDVANGELAREEGVLIRKTKQGELVYELKVQRKPEPGKMNVLTTAKGETYMVVLPDKSQVWLNAASTLRYPSSFAGAAKRNVQLEGEAYFEVAKDKAHPFTVESSTQRISVLGTHFDINSYPDNDATKTTLLEGSVAVQLTKALAGASVNSLILKPDQQAVVMSNSINVLDVESSDAVAWKNGYFMFNNEALGSIMQTLSRWYNTTIIYDDETLKNEIVFAKLSRYQNISRILKVMERTDKITFKVEGNTITISRKQKQ
jgi:transmembrane sensor